MSDRYDVIVIGGGVAGLSAAYFLSAAAKVLVLERESQPAYHSSGRSAALYIEGYENPTVSRLTAASGSFFRDPPDGFATSPLLHDRGGLTLAGPNDAAGLEKYLSAWQPLCPELRAVDRQAVRELVPIVRDDWVIGAAYDPAWKSIDVHELLQGYLRGIRANGGQLLTNANVSSVQRDGDWHVQTPNARYSAPVVANAAGSWAAHIGDVAGLGGIPLQPMRRTGVIVPPPPDVGAYPAAHTIEGNVYFKPESPGLMVCPADETPSDAVDAQPEEFDIAIAIDRFQAIVELPVPRVIHSWAGLRTFAPDRHPTVGMDPRTSGFFWLAGQGGFGVQTSPELGAMAAKAILSEAEPPADINVERLLV
jgi:D-arginine dehydrogenase